MPPLSPLLPQLTALLKGGHAHATLDEATKSLPASLRGKVPAGLPYSAWQLVEHIRITQLDILAFSLNQSPDNLENIRARDNLKDIRATTPRYPKALALGEASASGKPLGLGKASALSGPNGKAPYKPMNWPADYWPQSSVPPTPKSWAESLRQIRADREAFLRLLRAAAKSDTLHTPFPWAKGNKSANPAAQHTLFQKALLIADHTSYHTGELIAVRRLLHCWK